MLVWWNPKPDFCHTVIEHFAKLPLSSRIDYQGILDTANLSIVLNAHSRHICSKLLLICNSITTNVIYFMYFSWFYHNAVVGCFWAHGYLCLINTLLLLLLLLLMLKQIPHEPFVEYVLITCFSVVIKQDILFDTL